MIFYRCTACTRDHAGRQPELCEGCGLVAGSFAAIHLDLPEPFPEAEMAAEDRELERLYAEAGAVIGAGPQVSRQNDDDAPPTPRDGPEPPGPHVLEGKAKAEPPEVAQLFPNVAKAEGVCSQVSCDQPATHRFTWPGHPESRSCHPCALKAVLIAEKMGFFLEAPALDAPRPR